MIAQVPPPSYRYDTQYTIPGLASDSYTIFSIAAARIYHAETNKTGHWLYSRLKGILVFGRDHYYDQASGPYSEPNHKPVDDAETYWFRLLDQVSGKPTWVFRIPAKFTYSLDRPFFHVFQGRVSARPFAGRLTSLTPKGRRAQSRKFGFLFDDDDEAACFAEKVIKKTCPPRPTKRRGLSLSANRSKLAQTKATPISTSMISSPASNSFVHVSHVGFTKEGRLLKAAKRDDPAVVAFLDGLRTQSGTRVVEESDDPDSVRGFWRNTGGLSRSNSSDVYASPAPVMPRSPLSSF